MQIKNKAVERSVPFHDIAGPNAELELVNENHSKGTHIGCLDIVDCHDSYFGDYE